jgi:hypothetical protein
VAATAPVSNVVTVTLPSTVGQVSAVSIGYTNFSLSPSAIPTQGTYTYNPATQTLQINVGPNFNPTNLTIAYNGSSSIATSIWSDEVNITLPGAITNQVISSELTLSRSFEEKPSGSVSLKVLKGDLQTVLDAFRPRTEFTILGLGLAVAGPPQVKELKLKDYPAGLCEVSVSLTSKWFWKFEEPVKVRAAQGGFTTCQNYQTPFWLTADKVADKVGVPLVGSSVSTRYDGGTPATATTTLSEALQTERLRLDERFIFLSGSAQVECRKWGETPIRYLDDFEITTEIDFSYGGDEILQNDGLNLAKVYKNHVINLDKSDMGNGNTPTTVPTTVRSEPNTDPSVPPPEFLSGALTLEKAAATFDNGGPTRQRKTVTYFGNNPMYESLIKYGFAYTLRSVYQITAQNQTLPDASIVEVYRTSYAPGNITDWWKVVEVSEKYYTYDSKGYLVSIETTGWRGAREKVESGTETLDFKIQSNLLQDQLDNGPDVIVSAQKDFVDNKVLPMYSNWGYVPIFQRTEYSLGKYKDYYSDVAMSLNPCDADSMFCFKETSYDYATVKTPSPLPDQQALMADNLPIQKYFNISEDITTGRIFRREKELYISQTPGRPDADGYTTIERTSNQQGSQLDNSLQIAPETYSKGRPSPHTKLPQTPGSISATTFNTQSNQTWLLNTQGNGLTQSDPSWGSVSYPTADPQKASIAAEVDSSIVNTKTCCAASFTMRLRDDIQEGDRVVWRGQTWIALSIGYTIDFSPGRQQGLMALRLGRYLRPGVTYAVRQIV